MPPHPSQALTSREAGGEGQPQTQAALFSRYARYGCDLQAAISAPRWLLGRTWGEQSTTLKLEDGFEPALYEALAAAGHEVERVGPLTATMGHAGAIVGGVDDTALAKKRILEECGIAMAETPGVMAQTLLDHWGK